VPSRSISERIERLVTASVGITAAALAESEGGAELTLPQWRALVLLEQGGTLRVTDLAGEMGTSLPSASRLIRRVERRGLVTTERDEADRRATLVRLTPRGEASISAVMDARRGRIAAALRGRRTPLPEDLLRGLDAIIDALEHRA
jgi:DNA-binding MarR family transcriptional regulator